MIGGCCCFFLILMVDGDNLENGVIASLSLCCTLTAFITSAVGLSLVNNEWSMGMSGRQPDFPNEPLAKLSQA